MFEYYRRRRGLYASYAELKIYDMKMSHFNTLAEKNKFRCSLYQKFNKPIYVRNIFR